MQFIASIESHVSSDNVGNLVAKVIVETVIQLIQIGNSFKDSNHKNRNPFHPAEGMYLAHGHY